MRGRPRALLQLLGHAEHGATQASSGEAPASGLAVTARGLASAPQPAPATGATGFSQLAEQLRKRRIQEREDRRQERANDRSRQAARAEESSLGQAPSTALSPATQPLPGPAPVFTPPPASREQVTLVKVDPGGLRSQYQNLRSVIMTNKAEHQSRAELTEVVLTRRIPIPPLPGLTANIELAPAASEAINTAVSTALEPVVRAADDSVVVVDTAASQPAEPLPQYELRHVGSIGPAPAVGSVESIRSSLAERRQKMGPMLSHVHAALASEKAAAAQAARALLPSAAAGTRPPLLPPADAAASEIARLLEERMRSSASASTSQPLTASLPHLVQQAAPPAASSSPSLAHLQQVVQSKQPAQAAVQPSLSSLLRSALASREQQAAAAMAAAAVSGQPPPSAGSQATAAQPSLSSLLRGALASREQQQQLAAATVATTAAIGGQQPPSAGSQAAAAQLPRLLSLLMEQPAGQPLPVGVLQEVSGLTAGAQQPLQQQHGGFLDRLLQRVQEQRLQQQQQQQQTAAAAAAAGHATPATSADAPPPLAVDLLSGLDIDVLAAALGDALNDAPAASGVDSAQAGGWQQHAPSMQGTAATGVEDLDLADVEMLASRLEAQLGGRTAGRSRLTFGEAAQLPPASSAALLGALDGGSGRGKKAAKAARPKPAAAEQSGSAADKWAARLQEQLQSAAAGGARAVAAAAAAEGDAVAAAQREQEAAAAAGDDQVLIPPDVTIQQLAALLAVSMPQLSACLQTLGEPTDSVDAVVSAEAAELAALEFGKIGIRVREPAVMGGAADEALGAEAAAAAAAAAELQLGPALPRPPVVTIMGHVDHGKTSLLDALRKSNVAGGEAGGITQHIGAFEVQMPGSSRTITFLDTPGHAAFAAMRARGAAVTDVVVLVVSATDGVQPQTVEALEHAATSGCPMVVAVTKADAAPPQRVHDVKRQLAEAGVELEEYGGSVQVVATSARTGQGLTELEEALLLAADLQELKARPGARLEARVVEAKVDRGLGPMATVVVRQGTLRSGDWLVAGTEYGRVRALLSASGAQLQQVTPGHHAQVSGLRGVPLAGDELAVVATEERARAISEGRRARAADFRRAQLAAALHEQQQQTIARLQAAYQRRRNLRSQIHDIRTTSQARATNPALQALLKQRTEERRAMAAPRAGGGAAAAGAAPDVPELAVIVKADVQGSLEAIQAMLEGVQAERARLRLVSAGLGPPTPGDLQLAASTGATLLCFNVAAGAAQQQQQQQQASGSGGSGALPSGAAAAPADGSASGVRVLSHRIIYHLMDDVKGILEGMSPILRERMLVGTAKVLATFEYKRGSRTSRLAGVELVSGALEKAPHALFRILRGGEVVHEGRCTSLKQGKQAVGSVEGAAQQCGLVLDGGAFDAYQPGDVIECYAERERQAEVRMPV